MFLFLDKEKTDRPTKGEFANPRAICRDSYLGSWKECVRGKTNKTKWASQHCINC